MSSDAEAASAAQLRQLITAYWVSRAVHVAATLGIADLLAEGPKTSEELAEATDSDARALFRLLRALSVTGVVEQLGDDRFRLGDIGQYLRTDIPASLSAYALLFGDERQWRAWSQLGHSVRTGETAYEQVFGLGYYDYLAQDEGAAEVFDRAMAGSILHRCEAVVKAYDFSRFETVVDVGGGDGTLMAAILETCPRARGVVFERATAVERAKRQIAGSGLADRCQVECGDFFRFVPPGGDAYVLSRVLHAFDDQACIEILKSCRAAMGKDAVLLIIERVVPPGGAPCFAKLGDLNMLVLTGGRERTAEEYAALLRAAGLELAELRPTASDASVIEGRLPPCHQAPNRGSQGPSASVAAAEPVGTPDDWRT